MAVLDNTRVATGSFGLFGRIGAFFASVTHAVIDWNNARVARNVLSDLTDRELEDIGLCRGDIEAIARSGL